VLWAYSLDLLSLSTYHSCAFLGFYRAGTVGTLARLRPVQPRNRAAISSRIDRVLSYQARPDRLWTLPLLAFGGYRLLFAWVSSCRGLKLNMNPIIVRKLRLIGAIPLLPICIHGEHSDNFASHRQYFLSVYRLVNEHFDYSYQGAVISFST
jgi:hypothetical protein